MAKWARLFPINYTQKVVSGFTTCRKPEAWRFSEASFSQATFCHCPRQSGDSLRPIVDSCDYRLFGAMDTVFPPYRLIPLSLFDNALSLSHSPPACRWPINARLFRAYGNYLPLTSTGKYNLHCQGEARQRIVAIQCSVEAHNLHGMPWLIDFDHLIFWAYEPNQRTSG